MFKTTHNLPFLTRPWKAPFKIGDETYIQFKVGTVTGVYFTDTQNYNILAVVNDKEGNGHFSDTLEWFEQSCRRDKMGLVFLELINNDFEKHLIEKHGFKRHRKVDLIKNFT